MHSLTPSIKLLSLPQQPSLSLMESHPKHPSPHPLLKQLHTSFLNVLPILPLLLSIFLETYYLTHKHNPIAHLIPLSLFLLFSATQHYLSHPLPIYLIDFSCFKPPSHCRVPFHSFLEHATLLQCFDEQSVTFMAKIIQASGQGQQTYLPPPLHYIPPKTNHQESIKEAQMVLFPIMEDLLSKTGTSTQDIDILVVNCSGFCPSPSLSSIIVNKFKLKHTIKSFSLSGMGCGAGVIAIDLARTLLLSHANSNAVVLSTEIVSTGWYAGKDRRKLLLNCLFRMGSAAVLLSNKREAKNSSKYKLMHMVRTQRAFDDRAYLSAIREEDNEGITGFSIERELMQVAGETLRANIAALGLRVFPVSEKLRRGLSLLWKMYGNSRDKIYVPDFKTVIQHFCVPASGKALIREIGKGLELGEEDMEPALMTLQRFGNQSSSSIWYELAYVEAKKRVKTGDKVWQLGIGSGPKCNSVVWECLKACEDVHVSSPWFDCIGQYPVGSESSGEVARTILVTGWEG